MTVGYRQPAQFAKAFRRHHGAAPSALRGGGDCEVGGGPDDGHAVARPLAA